MQQLADKVIKKATNAIGMQSKMRKVDQRLEEDTDEKSLMQKVVSKFWFGQENPRDFKMVTDMTESSTYNVLFVAVSDSKRSSEVEIYDIDKGGFKFLRRIQLSEISKTIKDRINQELPSNSEISKLHFTPNNELSIFLEKGPIITLLITLTEIKPQNKTDLP